MARHNNFASRLYRGEVSFDFVGRQKLWYMISGAILAVSALALIIFGLNFSIDFKGGSQFQFSAPHATATQIESTFKADGGGTESNAQEVKPISGSQAFWQVQTGQLTAAQQNKLQADLAKTFNVPGGPDGVSISTVSASWGSQISQKAAEALIAFFIVIVIYLTVAFEWRMAAAALVALVH